MAAGTAAGLVPIRSITRNLESCSPRSLTTAASAGRERVSANEDGTETVTYLPESQEDAGPICLRLLGELKGIQVGKVEDKFGWCFEVKEKDGEGVERA